MKINNWLIGSDIEVFVQNENTGKFMSAAGDESTSFLPLVRGSKHCPHYIDSEKKFAVEVDNVSVEFLIPPTTKSEEFVKNIEYMMEYIKGILPAGFIPVAKASQTFDDDQLMTEIAQTFGCDRDLNAWTKTFNQKPNNNTNLRSNGLHIHIGYDNPSKKTSIELIKALDYYVGVGSLTVDTDKDRRSLYGKAGSFRFKPYGVEYRTLSSALLNSPEHLKWVFESVEKAIDFINAGYKVTPEMGRLIVKAINTSNTEMVAEIYNNNLITV